MTPAYVSIVPIRRELVPLTGIGIATEVARPCDEGLALVCAGGDGVYADGGHDGGVRELGLGSDDGVCDEVVDGWRRQYSFFRRAIQVRVPVFGSLSGGLG